MLLLPHQASALLAWINMAGAAIGIALITYELKARRAYVRA
jgi:small-conductance mechanosensitive channel